MRIYRYWDCSWILGIVLAIVATAVITPHTALSQESSAVSEAELNAEIASTIDDIKAISKEIIDNYVAIGQDLGLDQVSNVGDLARQRLDSMTNFVESVVDKLSPPDSSIFSSWDKLPSVKKFFNRALKLLLQPLKAWRDATAELKDLFSGANSGTPSTQDEKAYHETHIATDSLPSPNYYDDALCEWMQGWNRFERDRFWIQMALIDAQIDAVRDLCDQDLVVGGGGNAAILKAFSQTLVYCSDIIKYYVDDCLSNVAFARTTANLNRLEHVHGDLEIAQDTSDEVISNLRQHRMEFAEWTALSMRTRIEINLAGHGEHPHPIALFQLPQQYGGYLELARDIVAETITNMTAAGEHVGNAEKWLAKGDEDVSSASYKRAYEYYAKAYRDATRVGSGHDDDGKGH
jgi:hypothetical protein